MRHLFRLAWVFFSVVLYDALAQVTPQVSLDVYPGTGTAISLGTRTVFVCRVLGVTAGTQLTYAWTCPGGSCSGTQFSRTREDVLEVDVFTDNTLIFGAFTCTVTAGGSSYSASHTFDGSRIDGPDFITPVMGLTFGIDVIPLNSFVTDSSIPADNFNRAVNIRCSAITGVLTDWYLDNVAQPTIGVGQKHLTLGTATMIPANDEYECRLSGDQTGSYYLGLYLTNGVLSSLSFPSNLAASSILTNSLTVSWDAVSTATLYYVGYSIQGFGIGTVFPPLFERVVGSTSVTLTGLTPGYQYVITVWSSNGAGVSAGNSTITARTTEQAPSQPRSVTIILSSSVSLALNWLPPRDLNGAVHYIIEYSTSVSFTPTPQSVNTTSSSTHYTVDIQAQGIPGGTTYYFRVVAVNSARRANSDNTVNHCYETVPDTPGSLNGTAEVPSSVMLTWAAPEARVCDGSGITDYTIMYRLSSASSGAFQNMQTTSTSLTLTGLVGNAMYDVQVVATGKVGTSTAATATVTTGAGFPGPPATLQVSSGFPTSTSISFMWTAPTEDGGSSVTGYNVMVTGQSNMTVAAPTTSTTISGLSENTEYTVSVAAVNSAGPGPTAQVVETTLLSAPSIMTPIPGGRSASLSWTSTGFLFTVSYGPQQGGQTIMLNVTAKSQTLMSLTPLTAYDVFVSGFDSLNRPGEVGTAMFNTTAAAPTAPQGLTVSTISSSSIAVSWTVPVDTGGADITTYDVMVTGQSSEMVTGPTTSTTISGLNENTAHTISVAAVNSAGTGPTAQVVAQTLLSAPSIMTPSPGGRSASLSWTSTGSLFTVSYGPQQGGQTVMLNVTAKSQTLMSLTPLTAYEVFVSGFDFLNRPGEVGTAMFNTTAAAPTALQGLTVTTISSSSIAVSWTVPVDTGGVAIIRYAVAATGLSTMMVNAPTTSATISGLNENTEYTISVAAVNSVGNGPTAQVMETTLLSAPSNIVATPLMGGSTASLSWTSTGSLFTVNYRPQQVEQANMTVSNVATETLALMNLTPLTIYEVFISGFDSKSREGEAGSATFITLPGPPSMPLNLTVLPLSSSALSLSWAVPASNGGSPVINYQISVADGSPMEVSTLQLVTTISGLSENTEYTISVAAVSSAGTGPSAEITGGTLLSAPIIMTPSPGGRSASLSWTSTGSLFTVSYRPQQGGQTNMTMFNVEAKTLTLMNLTPVTTHEVFISGFDSLNRPGEVGTAMFNTTAAAPLAPILGTFTLNSSAITFTWAPPADIGGAAIINYIVTATGQPDMMVIAPTRSTTISGLNETTVYTISVAAVNSAGTGPTAQRTETTLLSAPTNVTSRPESVFQTNATIYWNPAGNNSFQVRVIVSTGGMEVYKGIVTQNFVVLTSLKPGTDYTIEVSQVDANNRPGDTLPYKFTTDPRIGGPVPPVQIGPIAGGIVGGLILLLVIIVLLIIVIVLMKKKKDDKYAVPSNKGENMYANASTIAMFRNNAVVIDGRNEADKQEEEEMVKRPIAVPSPTPEPFNGGDRQPLVIDPPATNGTTFIPLPTPVPAASAAPRTGPIPVDQFSEYVQVMNAKGRPHFEQEFKSIPQKTDSSMTVGVIPLNISKNRYKNIHPYDSTRIVLSQPNPDGSDYINASMIDGYKKKQYYIAAQGPTPKTVVDFWKMVWESKTPMIIMLTKAREGSKVKCEQYFAEDIGGKYACDSAEIKTLTLNHYVDYELRVMEMTKDGVCHTFDHYLFTGWPDYGVPKYPTALIRMLYHVRERRISEVPVVIHCSAGVGRTGTYMVMDMMLDRMSDESTIDIKGSVELLRDQRMTMVQTVDQYIFLHIALHELILCGDTGIKATDLRRGISTLKTLDNAKKKTGMEEQFDIVSLLVKDEHAQKETSNDLVARCRYKDRLPVKGLFMYVASPDPHVGSKAVNATSVDGYHAPKAFIAAQSPTEGGVEDFLSIILDKKVSVMVLLCNLEEDGQETCQKFWPDVENDTVKFGSYVVLLESLDANRDLTTMKLNISINMATSSLSQDLHLVHYKRWPERDNPISASLLTAFTSAQTFQHSFPNVPVMVVCNDGLGRTGTFIAFWTLVEQMKTERQIDVLSTVKAVKTQRPGSIPLLMQYIYCHDVVLDYIDSFEGYSNFN